jgi:hypothetical protein
MNFKAKVIGLVLVCIVLIFALFAITNKQTPQTGTLSIQLNLPNEQGLHATLNNKSITVTKSASTYTLQDGSYNLVMTDLNYHRFSTELTIHAGQTTIVNANLERSITANIAGWDQLQGSSIYPGVTITQTNYFYQNTWAVLAIELYGSDNAIVVVHYNDTKGDWQFNAGPGTSFTLSSLKGVPSNVITFLENNNYIEGGN